MTDEIDLLQKAQQLDQDALAEIFDVYYDSIYRYIYHHVHHVQTAEDLSSKVFQRLLKQLNLGRGPQSNLKAWLFRVAYHLIVDDSRRERHRNHSNLQDHSVTTSLDTEVQIETNQQIQAIYQALDKLTDKQRHIVVLRYLADMTPTEIAEALDMTVGSVKALQHRGIKSLRNQLQLSQIGEIKNE